jgi:nitrogen regulatory protein PII 2
VAIIRPEKWRATEDAIGALGAERIVQQRVLGRGRQRGLRYLRPSGDEEGSMQFLPKRMGNWLVPDELVDAVVSAILQLNHTGNYGDGKVFVTPIDRFDEIGAKHATAGNPGQSADRSDPVSSP